MKKRVLSLLLAVTMIFSLAIPSFAAPNTTTAAQIDLLKKLQLIEGEEDGVSAEYLAKKMTRQNSAMGVLKMLGKYEEALKYAPTSNFTDITVNSVKWEGGRNIIGYLKANPSYGFSGDDGRFKPVAEITQTEVLKVMLTHLGYEQGKDFTWTNVDTFAQSKGLAFTNGTYDTTAFIQTVYSALTIVNPKTNKTIVDILSADPVKRLILAEAGLGDTTNLPLAVVSTSIPNLKQVKVVYNREISKADAERTSAYEVKLSKSFTKPTITKAQLQDDRRTVLVTISNLFTNGSVNNEILIKTTTGIADEYNNKEMKASDSEFPTILKIEPQSQREFQVIFSEPVTAVNGGGLKVDNGTISVTSNSAVNEIMTIKLGTDLKPGKHDFTFTTTENNYIKDMAGLPMISTTYTYDYSADTNPIVAEIVEMQATTGKVEAIVRFSRAINLNSMEFFIGYQPPAGDRSPVNKAVGQPTKVSAREYKATFNIILPPGSTKLFLINKDTKNPAKDSFGTIVYDMQISGDIGLDSTPPSVYKAEFESRDRIALTFSESIDHSTSAASMKLATYTLKNPDGKKLPLKAIEYHEGEKRLILVTTNTLDGGRHTVDIAAGIKDIAVYPNTMAATTVNFESKDENPPTAMTAVRISKDIIKVMFSEKMNSSIGSKYNWAIQNRTINEVELSTDQKTVLIHVDRTEDITRMKLNTPADLAGNLLVSSKIASVSGFDTTITIGSQTGIPPKSISFVAPNQIDILVEGELLEGADANSFTVTAARPPSMPSGSKLVGAADIEHVNGDSIIHIFLTVDLLQTTADNMNVVLNMPTSIKNEYEAPLTLAGMSVTDKCGPQLNTLIKSTLKLSEAASGDTPAIYVARLYFTEAVYQYSVSEDDFELTTGKIRNIQVNDNYVELTISDKSGDLNYGSNLTIYIGGEKIKDKFDNYNTNNIDVTLEVK